MGQKNWYWIEKISIGQKVSIGKKKNCIGQKFVLDRKNLYWTKN